MFKIEESLKFTNLYILYIINISFLIDIIFNFHTGYFESGKIVDNKKKIAINYLKTNFISDILV